MPEVWCVFAHSLPAAHALAALLLADGHSVAIVARDVAPFAMLVNRHADRVLPFEVGELQFDTLMAVVLDIEKSLGAVHTAAITCNEHERSYADEARNRLEEHWPEVEILVVSQSADSLNPALLQL